jgi:protein TonB
MPAADTATADEMQTSGPQVTQVTLSAGATDSQDAVADPDTAERFKAIPAYRSNPLPEYPYQARQKRWEGVVWLLVEVSAEGLVDNLRVEQSCGHKILDRAAGQAVQKWRFSPALRAGLPVVSQVRIPVRFRLEDG